jgi:uncharacterized protein YcsI (UPF0317 family)
MTMMDISQLTPHELRALCRSGEHRGSTAGTADGHVQANLMILPAEAAFDFLLFCQRNVKPCPLVEVLEPGKYTPMCAKDGDVRSDFPGYFIYENGVFQREVADVRDLWRDDLVTFLIGCSLSFEGALMDAGITLRHVDNGDRVSMYKTNIACTPAGRFSGNMVVSMRPIKSADIARAVQISGRYPQVHGAPVHVGNPAAIGIADIARVDFGDPVEILDGEIPVFWACGVTPQYIAEMSKLPFCICHAPGKMFVTDLLTAEG